MALGINTLYLFKDRTSGAANDRHGLAQAFLFANAGDVPMV
jgi:hypothetical protein